MGIGERQFWPGLVIDIAFCIQCTKLLYCIFGWEGGEVDRDPEPPTNPVVSWKIAKKDIFMCRNAVARLTTSTQFVKICRHQT